MALEAAGNASTASVNFKLVYKRTKDKTTKMVPNSKNNGTTSYTNPMK